MQGFERSHGVVIGINAYQDGISRLRTAVADAEAVAAELEQRHAYAPIHLLTDAAATLDALRTLLRDTLRTSVGPQDRVLVYFAGHGVALNSSEGPEGFLLPYDARRADRTTYLPMQELYTALGNLSCHHLLLILDCCFSGAFSWAGARHIDVEPEVLYQERYLHYLKSPIWQVLTSSAYNERALDVVDGRALGERENGLPAAAAGRVLHSPFAQALLDALDGAADRLPPPNGDGVITAAELYAYLLDRMTGSTQTLRQTPMLWNPRREDTGQFIFVLPGPPPDLPHAEPLSRENNPYKGLQPFGEQDQELFFGREALRNELAKTVTRQAATIVLGASGAGKTSLVLAGLLPRLRSQNDPAWHILPVLRPGANPLTALAGLALPDGSTVGDFATAQQRSLATDPDALAAALAARPSADGAQFLLVVDQLEELYTMCHRPEERVAFMQQIGHALAALPATLHVVFTLRADYEPQFDDSPLAVYWIPAARFVLPVLAPAELRQIVVRPAALRVLRFEPPDLVDRIVDEVAQMPGALPLLSFTLSEMVLRYIQRLEEATHTGAVIDRTLTEKDYNDLGGVTGAVRHRADAVYAGLDVLERVTLRRLMLRMISVEGGLARRRVYADELIFPDPAEQARVERVKTRLSAERLIVPDRDASGAFVEPSHDALIAGWPRLSRWIEEAQNGADNLTFRRRLTQAAGDWQAGTAPAPEAAAQPHGAWRKALQAAGAFLPGTTYRGGGPLWTDSARVLLLELLLVRTQPWMNVVELRFAQASIRQHRRGRRLAQAAGVALVLISLVAVGAAVRAGLERRNLQRGESLLLSTLARQQLTVDPVASLNLALAALPGPKNRRPYSPQAEAALSRALQSSLERAYVEPVASIDANEQMAVNQAQIAIADSDRLVVAPFTPELGKPITLSTTAATGIEWHPTLTDTLLSFDSSQVTIWRDQALAAQATFTASVACATWDPNGARIAVCAGPTLWLWEPGSAPQQIGAFAATASLAAWSPHGSRLAAHDEAGNLLIWDAATQIHAAPIPDHERQTRFLVWADDEAHLVTATRRAAHLWSAPGYRRIAVLDHAANVLNAQFDGADLLTWTDRDPNIIRWDMTGTPRLTYTVPSGAGLQGPGVLYNQDHTRVLVTPADSRGYLWNLAEESPSVPRTLAGQDANITAAAWHGDLLATGDSAAVIRIWQMDAPRPLMTLYGHVHDTNERIATLRWLPGATTRLLSVASDGTVRIWQILDAAGRPVCTGTDAEGLAVCGAHYHLGQYDAARIQDATWLAHDTIGALDDQCRLLVWRADAAPSILETALAGQCKVVWQPDGAHALVYTTARDASPPYGQVLALPGGASVFTFTERINSVAWLDRGLLLVQPTSRGTRMRLYDPLAQRDWGKFPPLTDDLSAATSSGDLLVAPARNGAVFVRDLRTGASAVLSQTHAAPRAAPLRLDAGLLPEAQPTRAPAPSASRPQAVAGLALHSNGNILVSSTLVLRSDQGQDGAPAALRLGTEVTLWNLGRAQGQVLLTYTSDAPRSEVALSPELNLVAVISETHAVVLDALTGETRWDWEAHTNTIKDLQWRPLARWGGRGLRPLLITSSGDFTVRVWDIEQQSEILRLTHTTGVDLAAANDDGSYILTVDQNGVLHWWQTWLGDSSGLVATAAKVQTRPLSAEQEMAFQGRRQGE